MRNGNPEVSRTFIKLIAAHASGGRAGNLWITGEKKEDKEEKGRTFHRIERRAGMFRRVFPLPVEVVEEKVDARFAEGVLKITLPKAEKVAPKHIEIKG